jgi:hypothetical protein
VKPSPAILHLEQLSGSGIFDAYPNLRAEGGQEGAICYSQPEVVAVLADWMVDLKRLPAVEDVSVWMTENLHGQGGCRCAGCKQHDRDVLEAQVIIAAWQMATERVGDFGFRILTSEETRDSNGDIFDVLPAAAKVWYYDSLYTYTAGKTPMISTPVASYAARGRYAGVVPIVSAFVKLLHPFTGAAFIHYRMNEFADKGLSGLIGYATPAVRYSRFNVEAVAEWSWHASGRSTREFAWSWAIREGLPDPDRFADWAELIGPVEWDLYGSDWPLGERRQWPGPVAARLRSGTLPGLGRVHGAFRGPWGQIKSLEQFDRDVKAAAQALSLARAMGREEFRYESLVAHGYITALRALFELKQVVRSGAVAPADREEARAQFRLYLEGLTQAVAALREWATCVSGKPDGVEASVALVEKAIADMGDLARDLDCDPDASGSVPFRRGDANTDGGLDCADPVRILEYLFRGKTDVTCLDAADANDDGGIDLSDPIRLLMYLFAAGGRIPGPFPACGPDPTVDSLGCRDFSPCAP